MRKLLVFGVSLLLMACSQDLSQEILGSWQGNKQDLVFYADGRVELDDHKYSNYSGTYLLDGKTLECNFDTFAYPVEREVKLSGDKLYLIDKNGIKEVYTR